MQFLGMFVSDLRHFLDLPDDSPGPARKMVKQHGNVVRAATAAEAGLDVTKLRRRPGRPSMGSGPAETLPVRLERELRRAVDD
jgi:hypothetical protein